MDMDITEAMHWFNAWTWCLWIRAS